MTNKYAIKLSSIEYAAALISRSHDIQNVLGDVSTHFKKCDLPYLINQARLILDVIEEEIKHD